MHHVGHNGRGAFAVTICAALAFAGTPNTYARAQSASGYASSGVGHEIRIQATIPATCALRSAGNRIVLTGSTDTGEVVAFALGALTNGLSVECNTPYAMNLDRVTTLFPRRNARGAVASLPPAANDTTVASAEAGQENAGHDDSAFTIEVALAARDNPGGASAVAQRCAFSTVSGEGGCAVTGAADDVTAAPPRGLTRFALVAEGDAAGDVAVSDPVDLDEIARAGQRQVIPGVLLGPMKPVAQMKPVVKTTAKIGASEIATGSVPERTAALRRGRVLSESLRLSISGRF